MTVQPDATLEDARAKGSGEVALSVSNLGVKIGDKTILEKVTFDLPRGSTLAIVGPNGGGKTTLFRALMNMIPHSGTVTWQDEGKIGLVPQTLVAVEMPITVKEFLALKSKGDYDESIGSVGLDRTRLSQKLNSLSGGELQRVLIAMAILDRPRVLLFDEPTSGVDIGAEEPIYANLNHLKAELGITTLLISHNMHVVMHYSDYVLALNKHPLFFGAVKSISHSKLLEVIYGQKFDIPESEHTNE